MARKRWIVNQVDKSIANAIAEESNMDPFLALLLSGRGSGKRRNARTAC